jgi:hypothetical protein
MATLGVSSLTGCNSIPGFIASGTKTVFEMATAPVSWTKDTTKNQSMLRVVSGASLAPGGSFPFTTVCSPALAVSGSSPTETSPSSTPSTSSTLSYSSNSTGSYTVQPATVGGPQIISHSHPYSSWSGAAHFLAPGGQNQGANPAGDGTGVTGGSAAHTHGASGGTTHNHLNVTAPHSMPLSPVGHNHSISGSVNVGVFYVDMIIATKD